MASSVGVHFLSREYLALLCSSSRNIARNMAFCRGLIGSSLVAGPGPHSEYSAFCQWLQRPPLRAHAQLVGSSSTRLLRCCAGAQSSSPAGLKKRRLDKACLELRPDQSTSVIQSWIVQGKVLVDGQPVTKAGAPVKPSQTVEIIAEEPKFVCRAGLKLEKALDEFQIDVAGMVALDSGLSTGGFTDCLLQRGAARVYGVDVGYGQVDHKIRSDPRVVVMERTNVRYLTKEDLPEEVNIATLDLSFISVAKVIPAVADVLGPEGQMVILIKPQFEAGKHRIGAGGVVKAGDFYRAEEDAVALGCRDPKVHADIVREVTTAVEVLGFESKGVVESPILGGKGKNKEFLAHFVRRPGGAAGQ